MAGTSSGGAGSAGVGMNAGASGAGSGSPGGFVENSGADCGSSAGALKKNEKLPDPFAMHDGSRITSKAAWRCRRNEIKQDIEKYEIGPKPENPMVEASVSGNKLNVKVTTSAGSIMLSSTVSAASESASTNVSTVAAAAEQLSGSVAEISRQVSRSSEISSKAVQDAQRTNAIVQALYKTLRELLRA